ncbi:MAG: ABC transporter ATP-binding protein/permease [Roseburia sp.]|nr:ABC transporter ATP-binding protein/permease [Roseburia sp.]MCM1099340.1 ABC transporter ATP-binding protein/permease [Ruminococcus flavefaciens]
MKEKKYTLFGNLRYIYHVLYEMKPAMRLGVYGAVFFNLAGNVVGTVTLTAAVASITERGNTGHYLAVMAVMLAVYLFCQIGSQYVRKWSDYYYETAQNREFLMRLVKKSLHADYDNIESPAQQRLLTRATHAVNLYREGVNLMYINYPLILSTVLGILLYSLTISFFDWRILAIIVVMSVVSSLLEGNVRKFRAKTMDEQYRIWGRFYYLKQQPTSVENGKDIRIYNMQKWFRSGFDRLEGKNKDLWIGQGRRKYAVDASDALFVAARDLLAYGILVAGVLDGAFSIAEFTLGLSVVSGLAAWFGILRFHVSYLLEGNQMMCEYRKMMDYPDRFPRENGMSIPAAWRRQFPEIEFRNVSFRYEGAEEDTLKNLSFTIRAGEKIALVGHNGAGKTTLVKLLCGFYHPTEGEILIGGHSLESLNLDQYHELLAAIFQDVNTIPVSIAGNVSGRAEEETDLERVRECLRRAGLWKDVEALERRELTSLTQSFDPDGIQLSGGMMQKLMLARCLYKDAPLLVLDEPTAALDPIAESNLYEEYQTAARGKSALFISHRLASTKFCDRVLYLENGRILESGTHDELLQKKGKYAEVFEVQSQYYKEGGAEES